MQRAPGHILRYNAVSTQFSGNVIRITWEDLCKVSIPRPPKPEIQILWAWDGLRLLWSRQSEHQIGERLLRWALTKSFLINTLSHLKINTSWIWLWENVFLTSILLEAELQLETWVLAVPLTQAVDKEPIPEVLLWVSEVAYKWLPCSASVRVKDEPCEMPSI